MKKNPKLFYKTLFMVIISAFIYSLAMKLFVSNADLIPGGFSGIAQLITRIAKQYANMEISFGTLYILLNIIPTILVFKYVGKLFASFSVLHIVLVSVITDILPQIPMTDDILLISIFGGILAGFGSSVALRSNASGGGTDFIAIFFANKYNMPTWNFILAGNAVIILLAGLIFGWEKAMYSIIFQFCNTQVISALHQRYKLVTLHIITEIPDQISDAILKECRHGITKIDAEGQFSHTKKYLLYMTLNAYEVDHVIQIIKRTDSKVFINLSKSDRVVGNYYQQPLE